MKHNHNMSDYSDIINLPRPVSAKHPRMTMQARAAQFASFAALQGHKEEIRETEELHVMEFMTDEEKESVSANHSGWQRQDA